MKTSSLKKTSVVKKASARRAAVRFGRPPKELAGEVDERILDAARKVFVERGFEGASIDEIAEAARAGKPTIYGRFGDKRALFTEVVTRDVLSRITEFKTEVPTGATIEGAFHQCRDHPAALGFGQRKDRADAAGHSGSAPVPRSGEHRQPDGA
jgi:AcrR family transcriptional regulator